MLKGKIFNTIGELRSYIVDNPKVFGICFIQGREYEITKSGSITREHFKGKKGVDKCQD